MSTGALCTIISGPPGSGKTSYAVDLLQKEIEANPERQIFCMGLNGLKLPHQITPPLSEWTVRKPHPDDPSIDYPEFTFPDGSLIVIDEAQNVYRPRGQGSQVPPHVAAMERHRHKGLDFWLITQFPTMIDSNIRRLTGKHIHIRSGWFGRYLYEWSEAADPASKSERAAASRRKYKLPKHVFDLYKSATIHVKQERRKPWAAYALPVLVVAFIVSAWYGAHRINARLHPEAVTVESAASAVMPGRKADTVSPAPSSSSPAPKVMAGAAVDDWKPRIRTRPETAPMYDTIRQVRSMPTVAGCVATASRCVCYTEQGTDALLDEAVCREWLRHPPFNPWRERAPDVPAQAADVSRDAAAAAQPSARGTAKDGVMPATLAAPSPPTVRAEDSDRPHQGGESRGGGVKAPDRLQTPQPAPQGPGPTA